MGLVIIHHLCLMKYVTFPDVKWINPFTFFLMDGQLGVNVFFVISGFLITSLMLQEDTKTISLKNFYFRRTLRIFPAYYFMLLVYFILQLTGYLYINDDSWPTAITYTKYFNWDAEWYTSHAWSLSIEEHFYIIWPLIFLAGEQTRKYISISFIIIVPLIRIFLNFHPINWMSELTIFTRIDAISTGCLFALYKDNIIKRMNSHWSKIFFCSIIILFFLRYLPLIADKISLGFIFIPFGLTHGTIANLLIALIMMYSVFGPKGIWFKILNLKVINYLGLLSYSIYLWQQFFIDGSRNWIHQFPQNLFFIFIAALGSYYLIEKPFLKMKDKFTAKNKQNKIII